MTRWLMAVLLCTPLCGEAAWVQYNTTSFQVIGAFEVEADIRLTPGTASLEIPGVTMANIPWPVPAGCVAGRQQWTLVTSPGALPLLVNPTLIFFSSTSDIMPECKPVKNRKETRRAVDTAIANGTLNEEMVIGLAPMNAWFMTLCISVDGQGDLNWSTNANCVTWKTALDVVNSRYPSRAQGSALAVEMQQLLADQDTFLTAQCAANPGGPFCP